MQEGIRQLQHDLAHPQSGINYGQPASNAPESPSHQPSGFMHSFAATLIPAVASAAIGSHAHTPGVPPPPQDPYEEVATLAPEDTVMHEEESSPEMMHADTVTTTSPVGPAALQCSVPMAMPEDTRPSHQQQQEVLLNDIMEMRAELQRGLEQAAYAQAPPGRT
jgi:hypothetical protein